MEAADAASAAETPEADDKRAKNNEWRASR